MVEEVEAAPRITLWWLLRFRLQGCWWRVQHLVATRVVRLRFCHSCGGYFYKQGMLQPDKCVACEVAFVRDYGISVE